MDGIANFIPKLAFFLVVFTFTLIVAIYFYISYDVLFGLGFLIPSVALTGR